MNQRGLGSSERQRVILICALRPQVSEQLHDKVLGIIGLFN